MPDSNLLAIDVFLSKEINGLLVLDVGKTVLYSLSEYSHVHVLITSMGQSLQNENSVYNPVFVVSPTFSQRDVHDLLYLCDFTRQLERIFV